MEATFIETKEGKGFKIVVDGVWFYTSKGELFRALNKRVGCKFRTIDEIQREAEQAPSLSHDCKGVGRR